MPVEDRFVPRFAAEPPQDLLPYGRWAETLQAEFLAACLRVESEGEVLGEVGDILWFPDRTWHGRTFVPGVARTDERLRALRLRQLRARRRRRGADRLPRASPTSPPRRPRRTPTGRIDLCDEVIGTWRGEQGKAAAMTLVWGRPMVDGGAVATAELADLAVDQCMLVEGRFTLIAPDDYRGDTLDVKLFGRRGEELASESLYDEDEDED